MSLIPWQAKALGGLLFIAATAALGWYIYHDGYVDGVADQKAETDKVVAQFDSFKASVHATAAKVQADMAVVTAQHLDLSNKIAEQDRQRNQDAQSAISMAGKCKVSSAAVDAANRYGVRVNVRPGSGDQAAAAPGHTGRPGSAPATETPPAGAAAHDPAARFFELNLADAVAACRSDYEDLARRYNRILDKNEVLLQGSR